MSSSTATVVQSARQERVCWRGTAILFAFTSFLSAFLLFQVQLIVSKYILPWFGGSAAVWITSMLVFQLLLLAGYIYSHVLSLRLSSAAQARFHVGLLGLAFLLMAALSFLWPSAITPGAAWKPLPSGTPARDVAAIILISAGLPFFVLSTTGPLLQAWFARLGGGIRTYKLYSVSNLGSLLGLLTFPFLVEPALRMQVEARLWSLLFCVFAGGCAFCAWRALKSAAPAAEDAPEPAAAAAQPVPRPLAYALWFLLAACASSLLLATTNLLCQEVITVPLLWVLPLALYLVSFILCFDHPRWYQRAIFHPLFAVCLLLTCAALGFGFFLLQLAVLPVLLWLTCMICHGELARLKPGVRDLTSFYLAISAGGAAGGIFVAVLAPRVFTSFLEYQLSLGAAVVLTLITLVLDPKSWIFRSDYRLPAAMAIGALLAGYASGHWLADISSLLDHIRYYPLTLLLGTVAAVGAFIMRGAPERRGFRFVQILVAGVTLFSFAALYRSALPRSGLYLSSRSFYGMVRVFRQPGGREIVHGQTIHGSQMDPPGDRYPTLYYSPGSGIGVVLKNHPLRSVGNGSLRLGVVGLGAGTLAAYGRPGDSIRFYEINPDVVKLSTGARPVFTYLRDSAAHVSIALGDARLSLEREAADGQRRQFDVLVLDAFTSDSIPVHLLTREAFETYWRELDPDNGIIAVHITSRHVDLVPVLQGAAAYFHAAYLIAANPRQGSQSYSTWVLMTRRPELLNLPGLLPITARYAHNVEPRLWTDDYSDISRLIF